MQKGPDQFGFKFQEILILLPNLNVFKRPYPCHALGRSLCLGQGCLRAPAWGWPQATAAAALMLASFAVYAAAPAPAAFVAAASVVASAAAAAFVAAASVVILVVCPPVGWVPLHLYSVLCAAGRAAPCGEQPPACWPKRRSFGLRGSRQMAVPG